MNPSRAIYQRRDKTPLADLDRAANRYQHRHGYAARLRKLRELTGSELVTDARPESRAVVIQQLDEE